VRIIQEIDCGLAHARAAILEVHCLHKGPATAQAGKGFELRRGQRSTGAKTLFQTSEFQSCRMCLAEKERTRFGPVRKITGVSSAFPSNLVLFSTTMAPVAEKVQAAPATHKQPSRKGKKAWRKNVDITELQEGVADVREQIIQGYGLAICLFRIMLIDTSTVVF
jgi:hypothetical protein